MNSKNRLAVILVIIFLVISGGIFAYFKLDIFKSSLDRLRTKKVSLESTEVTFLNSHPTLTVSLNDRNKMDQVTRIFSESFPNRYQQLQLVMTKDRQESMFGWDTGNTFGYTLKPDQANKTLTITFYVGEDTLRNAGWENSQIEGELEYYLLHALERERISHQSEYAVTRTVEEEVERNAVVETNIDAALEQLNVDNSTTVFSVK